VLFICVEVIWKLEQIGYDLDSTLNVLVGCTFYYSTVLTLTLT